MDRVNPVYIPRNHLVEEALAAATAGDLEPFERLVDVRHAARSTSAPASRRTPRRRPSSCGLVPDVLRHLAAPSLRDVP